MDTHKIADILHSAAETHHTVWLKEKGDDPDWASWYAEWLLAHSDLSHVLGKSLVTSELTYLLVALDKAYTEEKPDEPWEAYYARGIATHFS